MAKKILSLPVDLVAMPHNGRPEYRRTIQWTTPAGVTYEAELGGQNLLIILACYLFKRLIVPVGRRFGKSTGIPYIINEKAQWTPGTFYALYIAQSHDKAYEIMDYCERFWGGVNDRKTNPGGLVKRRVGGPKDQHRFLEVFPLDQLAKGDFPGGPRCNDLIRVYFVSGAHPHYEKIRGYPHPMDLVLADEFALIHPKLLRVVMPMLGDREGTFVGLGTTDEEGIGNATFHRYYQRGMSDDPKYASWGAVNFPSHANPTLTEDALREMVNDCLDDDEVQQEIHAKFIEGKGAVFSNFAAVFIGRPEVCNGRHEQWPQWVHDTAARAARARGKAQDASAGLPDVWIRSIYDPAHEYAMSVDWAKARDCTVIGVYDLTLMRQVALFRFHGDNFTEQFVWARSVKEAYQAHEFHGDENTGAGQSMGDMLRTEYETGIHAHRFNTYSKANYVRNGQIIFYEARVEMMDVPEQVIEFKEFKRYLPESEKGEVRVSYSHPPGGNDDFVDSFLQIGQTILTGVRAMEEKPKPKGYTLVAPDGTIDMAMWDDAPSPEALEEAWDEERYG